MDVFDFFSGCGGTSLGFQNRGFRILGGIDFDKDCARTFRANFPNTHFIEGDICTIKESDLTPILTKADHRENPLLFCGCAPCQPFTKQRRSIDPNDKRKTLLSEFQRFIEYWLPDYIFLENVPGLQKINKSGQVFKRFTAKLRKLNYSFDADVVLASELGVPQMRNRFILIGARQYAHLNSIKEIIKENKAISPSVWDCIGDLPPLRAGEKNSNIANHACANLSNLNLTRIKNTPEGGDRRDWPEGLKAGCHLNYKGHTDVYGRMNRNGISATLTTKCISYSNGRFGHPTQDRAISVREAARLQTFPDTFEFMGTLNSCAKQVGNAVPPLMAEKISKAFI